MISKLKFFILLFSIIQLSVTQETQQIQQDGQQQEISYVSDEYEQLMKENDMRLAEVRKKIKMNTNVNPPELQEAPILLDFESTAEQALSPLPEDYNNDNDALSFAELGTGAQQQDCDGNTIKIPIFERQADIGELYDARTDFLHVGERLWLADATKSKAKIIQQATPRSDFEFSTEKSFEDKLKGLDVSGEFACSLMAGQLTVAGKGQYLNNEKKNSRVQRGVLTYQLKTVAEKVQDLSSITYLDDQFTRKDVTHVVTGLEWGSIARVIADYEMSDSDDAMQINGQLEATFKTAAMEISGKLSLAINEQEKKMRDNFKIKTIADVVSGTTLPQTMEEAVKYMTKFPVDAQKSNNGKGKAQFMILTPICMVKKNVPAITKALQGFYKEMKANLLLQLTREFRQLDETTQLLATLKNDFDQAPPMMVGNQKMTEFQTKSEGFERFKNDKKEMIKAIMIKYRSGKDTEGDKLVKELNQYKANSSFNTSVTNTYIEQQNKQLVKRIRIVNELQTMKPYARIVQDDLKRDIGDPTRSKVVLYYTVDKVETPDDNFEFFKQVMKNYKPLTTDYFIVLFDLLSKYNTKNGATFIEYYKPTGRFKRYLKLTSNDYLNYNKHDSAVIVNPEEVDNSIKWYYVGELSQNESRSGQGKVYSNANTAETQILQGNESSARSYLIYEGNWENDLWSGFGTTYLNGDKICEGQFSQGNASNFLQCIPSFGNYKGELNSKGQKHGTGVIIEDTINNPDVQCDVFYQNNVKIRQTKCWNSQGTLQSQYSAKLIKLTQNTQFLEKESTLKIKTNKVEPYDLEKSKMLIEEFTGFNNQSDDEQIEIEDLTPPQQDNNLVDENNLSLEDNKNFVFLGENNEFDNENDSDDQDPIEDDDFGLFDPRVPTDYSRQEEFDIQAQLDGMQQFINTDFSAEDYDQDDTDMLLLDVDNNQQEQYDDENQDEQESVNGNQDQENDTQKTNPQHMNIEVTYKNDDQNDNNNQVIEEDIALVQTKSKQKNKGLRGNSKKSKKK